MTLLRMALASHRVGAVATAALGAAFGLANSIGYVQVAGRTHEERLGFAQQMAILGQSFAYLLPRPIELDTMGGYLTWRNFSSVTVVCAIWAAVAASGAGRGDEDRGLVETSLAAGASRTRWLATRAVGFTAVAALTVAAVVGIPGLGAALSDDPLPIGRLAAEGLAMLATTLCAFGIGLVVAQLVVTRRAAATGAGMLLVALFVLNSAGRVGIGVGAARWLSPFYLFDRSAPLLEGGSLDVGATLGLLAAAAALVALAVAAFARRDLGAGLLRLRPERARRTTRPAGDPLLRVPVLASVDQQRWWVAAWAAALGLLAFFLTSITRALLDSLIGVPGMRFFFERQGIAAYADLVGVVWFSTALLLISVFVVTQVGGWAADDSDGRLETALAATASRPRVVLERIAAVLVAVALIEILATAAVFAGTRVYDIAIAGERMVLAGALTLPVVFALAGIGHALVGWRPRVAVVALSAVAALSYLDQEFAALFDWPEWVRRASLYTLYGMPLTRVDWGGIATLTAIGAVGTAVALATMQRRDVGR